MRKAFALAAANDAAPSERAPTFRHHGALPLAVATVPVDNHPAAHPEQGVMTELELAPRPDSPSVFTTGFGGLSASNAYIPMPIFLTAPNVGGVYRAIAC